MKLHLNSICVRALALSALFLCVDGVGSSLAQISVSGTIWIDSNEDGVRDSAEPFPAPGSFVLWVVSTNDVGTPLAVATNGALGLYSFSGLSTPDAPYQVYVVIPPGATNFLTLQGLGSHFDPGSGLSDTFSSNAVRDVGIVNFRPALSILKLARDTSSDRLAAEGSTLYVTNNTWVEYTYAITNSGNLYFSSVLFLDDPHIPFYELDSFGLGTCMAPGESIVITNTIQISASVTNMGTVVGEPGRFKGCESLGLETVVATNDAVVIVVRPEVSITKTLISPTNRPTEVGETNIFEVVIENTGDVDLDVVPLEDRYDTNLMAFVAASPAPVNSTNDGILNWTNLVASPLAPGNAVTVTTWFAAINTGIGTNYVVTTPTNLTVDLPVEPKSDTEVFTNINPNVVIEKSVDDVGDPDSLGFFSVRYRIVVTNVGGGSTSYDVIDTPDFDGGIDVLAASVTGHVATNIPGAGPYTVAVDQVISAGGGHEYWITVSSRLSAAVMFGSETVSQCNETNENQYAPGSGLFNESVVLYGPYRALTNRAHDCDDVTIPNPVQIGDTVWYDRNTNGVVDLPAEDLTIYGLSGVQVRLIQIIGSYTNITTNMTHIVVGSRGYYEFKPLPFGYFIVELIKSTVPVGFHIPSTPLAYTNQLVDFVLVAGTNVIDTDDFGLNNKYLTPIELESLSARVDGDAVVVEWVTSWESETLGYHIYRSATGSEADRVRVSGGLIPGAGGANGHAYAWTDETVESGHVYHYWLVEEATNGDLAWYGPVAVSLDNVDSGKDLARYSLPAGGDALVRVSYETLLEAGLPVSQLDAGQLQVFVDGSEVARFVSSPGDTLQAGDFVLFHVGASDSAQHVSIRVSDSDPALAPSWIYARPRRGVGDVRVIDSAGAGQLAFEHEGGPVRTVLTGFNVPSVWLFDVTDPERSGLIYGYATVAGENDSFALYLSLPVDTDMRGLAVEDSNVIDLKDVDRE